ncbi:MAG: hypothetical protein FD177_220 [Desulfovibrionaceae bacterium]|nr:MAG: hypothetical protein FD177_220 [Desulfovibrionaceae bacterium]
MKAICHTTCEINGAYYEMGWEGHLDLPEDHPSLTYFTLSDSGDGGEGSRGPTKDQLMAALDAKGVKYPANAKKGELQELLDANQ